MFNFLALIPLLKSAAPGLLLLAEAFRYGVRLRGGETWKGKSARYHVDKATHCLTLYFDDMTRYSLLADACLRLLFALCLSGTRKYVPKDKV